MNRDHFLSPAHAQNLFYFILHCTTSFLFFFFFQAEDGIRDYKVTGVQTCALPILAAFIFIATRPLITTCECCSMAYSERGIFEMTSSGNAALEVSAPSTPRGSLAIAMMTYCFTRSRKRRCLTRSTRKKRRAIKNISKAAST